MSARRWKNLQTADSQRSLWVSGMHPIQHLVPNIILERQETPPGGTWTRWSWGGWGCGWGGRRRAGGGRSSWCTATARTRARRAASAGQPEKRHFHLTNHIFCNIWQPKYLTTFDNACIWQYHLNLTSRKLVDFPLGHTSEIDYCRYKFTNNVAKTK